ncbi:MAG: glycosyltransferase family 2 protein [Bdellovibrionales bacterium]|nr:glycosyltransferase family 2 protein [Bdellovibrionales bacterium]
MSDDKNNSIEQWLSSQEKHGEDVELSVIIPAYNEQWRLPTTLIDIIDYFDRSSLSHEIIVVDDGSSDETEQVVRKFERICPHLRLVRLPKNYGKGHAVRTGMLSARGKYLLFTDADGSTPIKEIERLFDAVHQGGAEIAIGSRAMESEDTLVETVWYRKFLGRTFHFFVHSILLPGFHDTQCGFKLFTKPAARFVFSRQRANGFSFDLEILHLAQKAELTISEVPVNWTNVAGSKVNLLTDAAKMFKDLFVFRIRNAGVSSEDFQHAHQEKST